MRINADNLYFKDLNQLIKNSEDCDITVDNCLGQRYIGNGLSNKKIVINGTPGNALGAYLNGADIFVNGNVQDAVGDTMNSGTIIINGSCGDAVGYGMRGGKIIIKNDAGYRAGIHMKSYKEKLPILIIGGKAGNFLGEYLAGGLIIVLGLNCDDKPPIGDFCGTGMYGGKIYVRSNIKPENLPKQVVCNLAKEEDIKEIDNYLNEFCNKFNLKKELITQKNFYVLNADTKNPYRQLYAHV